MPLFVLLGLPRNTPTLKQDSESELLPRDLRGGLPAVTFCNFVRRLRFLHCLISGLSQG